MRGVVKGDGCWYGIVANNYFAIVYTMNSFLQNSVGADLYQQRSMGDEREQIAPWFNVDLGVKMVGVGDGIALMIRRACYRLGELRMSLRVVNLNGSAFEWPSGYRSMFPRHKNTQEKIAYIFQSSNDFFLLDIDLTLSQIDLNFGLEQQLSCALPVHLSHFRDILVTLKYNKLYTKRSFQMRKTQLKFKKTVASAVVNSIIEGNVPEFYNPPSQPTCSVFGVHEIKELPQVGAAAFQGPKKGGLFQVTQKQCEITANDGSKTTKTLALKTAKKTINSQTKITEKIQKQLKIANLITNNKYTVNYYIPAVNPKGLYMDYIGANLKDLLYQGRLTISDTFSIAKQLIEGVAILHSSSVVHRDLKLENILVDKTGIAPTIKIIDFGDSALSSDVFNGTGSPSGLGCSAPYSPIECLMDMEEGFNRREIDYWSVVLIIYEMFFSRLPFYFNRKILNDLVDGWSREGEFCPSLELRPRRGFRLIERTVSLLAESGLKIKQKQRVKLSFVMDIIRNLQTFYIQMLQLTQGTL